jgi:hypothetical protein
MIPISNLPRLKEWCRSLLLALAHLSAFLPIKKTEINASEGEKERKISHTVQDKDECHQAWQAKDAFQVRDPM